MIKEIVKHIGDPSKKETWRAEAYKWRLPYRDWAREVNYSKDGSKDAYKSLGLPWICIFPDVPIEMPGKKNKVMTSVPS